MAATGIATHSTVKDRERAWDDSQRRKRRWNASPRARRGKPLAYPRKESHVTWPQLGSQLTTRQSKTVLHNRRVVYTRRGRAATSFKELLQRRRQGKLCTIFFLRKKRQSETTQNEIDGSSGTSCDRDSRLTHMAYATWTGTADLGEGSQPTLREGPTEPHRYGAYLRQSRGTAAAVKQMERDENLN